MFELLIEDYFSAAHSLKYYEGRCENMHGHNWKVQVYIESDTLNKVGLVVDFKDMKQALHKFLDIIDHTNLNEVAELGGLNPTSENLAKWLYGRLGKELNSEKVKVTKIRVWESRDAAAAYFEDSSSV